MDIDSERLTALMNKMSGEFLELSLETETITLEELAYCLLFSVTNNLELLSVPGSQESEDIQFMFRLHLQASLNSDIINHKEKLCTLPITSTLLH